MRIAYLINQYPAVSHTFIRREILALERRGVEVQRIALRGWDTEIVDEEDVEERKRTRYVLQQGVAALLVALLRALVTRPVRFVRALGIAWRMGLRAERPLPLHLIYLAEACRIEPWLRTSGVEHVHAHFGTNSAEVAMLVHALGGPHWSFTVHGPTEFDDPEFIGLAQKVQSSSFVVAISSYCRSQIYRWVARQHWPKVQMVHCGLESGFYKLSGNLKSSARRLVCVGRLCEQKGQLLLVDAAYRLASKGVDFELVLVGDGEMRPQLEAMIKEYQLQSKVRITGRASSTQVRHEILSARALVLASFAEGLPVVIMEAMALRRPILTTYVAGIPELVESGKHGWLVPAGDVEALVDAMQTCLETPSAKLACMGEAAYQRVTARHCTETQATELATLFKSAIARSPGA